MPGISLSYVDDALDQAFGPPGDDPTGGQARIPFWRHFHWGLYEGPDVDDDSPARYYVAAEAMTRHVVAAGEVADGARVLDVGCGFGGTLDLVRTERRGCGLVGLNIDERQLRAARRLLAADAAHTADAAGGGGAGGGGAGAREGAGAGGAGRPIAFVTGDGCRLPVAERSLDHVLAVECLFHFPSRKAFFKEAARVLRPGGTVALCDFVATPGAVGRVLQAGAGTGAGEGTGAAATEGDGAGAPAPGSAAAEGAPGDPPAGSLAEVAARKLEPLTGPAAWYGSSSRPLTAAGYARLTRAAGFDLLADDDVTARTLPTYAALRRMHRESSGPGGRRGELGALSAAANEGLEQLMLAGDAGYRVMSFRRRAAGG